jgi:hypothetical protein
VIEQKLRATMSAPVLTTLMGVVSPLLGDCGSISPPPIHALGEKLGMSDQAMVLMVVILCHDLHGGTALELVSSWLGHVCFDGKVGER